MDQMLADGNKCNGLELPTGHDDTQGIAVRKKLLKEIDFPLKKRQAMIFVIGFFFSKFILINFLVFESTRECQQLCY